jgi:hypothetical protein
MVHKFCFTGTNVMALRFTLTKDTWNVVISIYVVRVLLP